MMVHQICSMAADWMTKYFDTYRNTTLQYLREKKIYSMQMKEKENA